MLRHVKFIYEDITGKKFGSEEEAYAHENAYIYKKSGFRFYRKNGKMIKEISLCYDEADYFTIDHSKEEWNKHFCEMAYSYFGWLFPDDILTNKEAKRYRYDDDSMCWKSVSRRKYGGNQNG